MFFLLLVVLYFKVRQRRLARLSGGNVPLVIPHRPPNQSLCVTPLNFNSPTTHYIESISPSSNAILYGKFNCCLVFLICEAF